MSFSSSVLALSEKIPIEDIPSMMEGSQFYVPCNGSTPTTRQFYIGAYLTKYLQFKGCVACGLRIKYAQVRRVEKSSKAKLYFFGERNGQPVLFTRDHCLPKSWGGQNSADNIQPMCTDCNGFKGNSLTMDPRLWVLRKKVEFRCTTRHYVENWQSGAIDGETFARRMHQSIVGFDQMRTRARTLFNIEVE